MLKHRLDLLITTKIQDMWDAEKPYEKCGKCIRGEKEKEYCECTISWLGDKILNVPSRYNVDFVCKVYENKKEELIKSPLVLIKGHEFYAKLIAFDMAKKFVLQNKIAYYLTTKQNNNFNNFDEELASNIMRDLSALKFSDLVIIEDLMGNSKMVDSNYKVEVNKRVDDCLPTIFINTSSLVKLTDNEGEPLPDVKVLEVDTIGIQLKK